jgi:hypothetical protein
MSEWIDFERWPDCPTMQRPGIVFEIVNDANQSMLTECVVPLPIPTDWTSRPVRFRTVPEPEPRRSSPIPEPVPR